MSRLSSKSRNIIGIGIPIGMASAGDAAAKVRAPANPVATVDALCAKRGVVVVECQLVQYTV